MMTARRLALRSLLLATALLLVTGAPAGAHSFLVSTTPGQGERLRTSPDAVVLDFSEAVDAATMKLGMRDAHDRPVNVTPPELIAGALSIRSSLPPLHDGIYVVSWQAFSDVDGHGSFGEHSFAFGDVNGSSLPATTSSSSGRWWGTVASWLFFAGFAGAAGPLVVQLLAVDPAHWERTAVRAGMAVALAGAVLSWAERTVAETSSGIVLAAVTAALVAVATSAHTALRRPTIPLALLVAAAVSWSGRSHAASVAGLGGAVVDSVHLVAGGIWSVLSWPSSPGCEAAVSGEIGRGRFSGAIPAWPSGWLWSWPGQAWSRPSSWCPLGLIYGPPATAGSWWPRRCCSAWRSSSPP
jgi:methionine-rich copper-binding protein CopC